MRLILLGSPECVVEPFKHIIQHASSLGHEVIAIISQPARQTGRGKKLMDPPVASFAKDLGIKTLQPEKASDPEFLNELKSLEPDVMITAAYGQILTQNFLDIPTRGTINIHPSLLPKYRGAVPVPAALLAGDRETGVSILFTVKKLDAGNLILQEKIEISDTDQAESLLYKLFSISGPMVFKALEKLKDNSFTGDPQNESLVTHCKKIEKTDGLIDWNESAPKIEMKFKGLFPWPGLYSFFADKRVNLESVNFDHEVQNREIGTPGQFTFAKDKKSILIQTSEGIVSATQLKTAGGKSVDAASFWNGIKNKEETYFVSIEES